MADIRTLTGHYLIKMSVTRTRSSLFHKDGRYKNHDRAIFDKDGCYKNPDRPLLNKDGRYKNPDRPLLNKDGCYKNLKFIIS